MRALCQKENQDIIFQLGRTFCNKPTILALPILATKSEGEVPNRLIEQGYGTRLQQLAQYEY